MNLVPAPLPAARRACLAFAVAVTAGCGGIDPALLVQVAVDPAVKSTCIQISVFTSPDASGAPAEVVRVVRSPGKNGVEVAVFKGALPAHVWVSARPMWGAGCELPLSPNGDPETVEGAFPPSGIDSLPISIDPLPQGQDADGDGFQGGGPGALDCDDGDGGVNPGASERCLEPVDANCDGRVGCADPTCPASACLASPVGLAFTTNSRTFNAGGCSSAVTVQTQDAAGMALAVVAPTTVTFGSPDGRLTAFADNQCQNARTSAVIPTGSTTSTVFLSGTVAGPATLTATAQGLPTAQQQHTIRPATINRLAFTTPQQTVALNGCSEPMTVQLQDAYGNPTPVGFARTVTLGATGGGAAFRFYPDAACANSPITQTQIAATTSSATFYVKSTATTPATVTVTATEGSRSANQAVTLVARTPTRLAFLTGPLAVPLNACSPAVTVQTQDNAGQPAPVTSPFNVSLGVSPGGAVAFLSDPSCNTSISQVTIGTGLNQASFHFRGAQQGPATLTASSALTSPTLGVTISPPLPTQLAFATQPKTVAAGACSGAVEIEARDAAGTPAAVNAATQIDLASLNPTGSLTFHPGASCGSPPVTSVTMASGSSRVTFSFTGTRTGTPAISASTASGTLTPAQQTQTVTAGPASKVRIISGAGQSVDAGACSAAVVVELEDAFDNPVTAGSDVQVALSSNPAGAVTFFATCGGAPTTQRTITSGGSTTSFVFSGTTPRTLAVTATPQPTGSLAADSAPQTIRPSQPTSLRFTSPAQPPLTAGTCSGDVVLTTFDAANNVAPVAGNTSVALGSSLADVSFYAGSGCSGAPVTAVTIAGGASAVTYSFIGTRSGTGALSASANGLTSPTPQAITVNAAALAGLRFIQGPVTVNAGSCSGNANALRIQSVDAYGNPVNVQADTDVTVSAQNPATGHPISFYGHFNCSAGGPTNTFRINAGANLTNNEIFFRTNGAGTWAFRGDFAGLTSAMENETVNPLAATKVDFTSPPQTLNHNPCSDVVTLQAQDQHGNASPLTAAVDVDLGPGSMSFFTNQNCNGPTITRVTIAATTANQQYYFRTPNSGPDVTITLGPTGSSGLAGASQVVTLP